MGDAPNDGGIRAIADFCDDFFVKQSNDGIVLNLDLSQRLDLGIQKGARGDIILTDDEVNERKEWKRRKLQIHLHCSCNPLSSPEELTLEEFLTLRVAAPCLLEDSRCVSFRSSFSDCRANRHCHPQRIEVWNEFEQSVENFRAHGEMKITSAFNVRICASPTDVGNCWMESDEEKHLVDKVFEPLMEAGLVGNVIRGSMFCQGEPNSSAMGSGNKTKMVGEIKATHGLPLPMTAQELAAQCNEARALIDEFCKERSDDQQRPMGWSHVGHPISQILGCMVLNNCRHSVLTGGTRTHFILLSGDAESGKEKVRISDAWFIGQEGHLHVWAFFYSIVRDGVQPDLDKSGLAQEWLEGMQDKLKKRPPPPTNQGASKRKFLLPFGRWVWGGSRDSSKSWSSATKIIPVVTLGDFEVTEPIGHGCRGTAFSGKWSGEVIALKLFDTHKNKGRDACECEAKAHEHLKKAWGRLVPTPKFVAEAFGVIHFGMQMAEEPPQQARLEDWDEVLWELEETHGFRHLDVGGDERGLNFRNHMMLPCKSKMMPIVIDLEEHELL